MKRVTLAIALTLAFFGGTAKPSTAQSLSDLDGVSWLEGYRGQFLGEISSNSYNSQSICNSYGTFGSDYSAKSIWSEYGQYGSEYSNMSAYSQYAKYPPHIMVGNQVVAFVTRNSSFENRVDPAILKAAICER
jgi:hypothetical protein